MTPVPHFMVGCAAVITRPVRESEHREVLLGLRSGDPAVWSLPGGKVEPGEQFAVAISRETLEECGIVLPEDVAVDRFVHRTDGDTVEVIAVAECAVGHAVEPVNGEPERFADWRWFRVDDLPDSLFPPTAAVLLDHQSPRVSRQVPHSWTYSIDRSRDGRP